MNCGWCGDTSALGGPALRCKFCGGAHRRCPAPGCRGALIPECKPFCSNCGGSMPAPGRPRFSRATCVTQVSTPWNFSVEGGGEGGGRESLFVPGAMAYCVGGRMLALGDAQVFVSTPPPGCDKRFGAGLARVDSPEWRDGFTLPAVLEQGVLLFGTRNGLRAFSVHSSQCLDLLEGSKITLPPIATAGPEPGCWTIWAVSEHEHGENRVQRIAYRPNGCIGLEPSPFKLIGEEQLERPAALGSGEKLELVAACSVRGADNSEQVLLAALHHKQVYWWKPPAQGSSNPLKADMGSSNAFEPPVSARRRLLSRQQEWTWIYRRGAAGSSSGALALVGGEEHAVSMALGKNGREEFTLHAPGDFGDSERWRATVSGVSAGWRGDDPYELELGEVNADWNSWNQLKGRRGELAGPWVPTAFGCATFLASASQFTWVFLDGESKQPGGG